MKKHINDWKSIFHQYEMPECFSNATIQALSGYPHIFFVSAGNNSFVVKKVARSKENSLDELFESFLNNKYILFPLVTNEGHYFAKSDTHLFLLYPRIGEIKEPPSYDWWGRCLSSIHNSEAKIKSSSRSWIDDECEAVHLLNDAKRFMEDDIYCRLIDLLNYGLSVPINPSIRCVICHSDPSQNNVLVASSGYKLIDMENCMFAPPEYDIQHLLWNYSIAFEKYNEWEFFCKGVLKSYISNAKLNVDCLLLIRTLCFDFVKCISWLYLVSNDSSREDQNRQAKELASFNKRLRQDWLAHIINYIHLKT